MERFADPGTLLSLPLLMNPIAHLMPTLRRLLRSPGTPLTAAGILGLGIGAAVAVFSVVDAVLLAPPPYERPDRLVLVERAGPDGRAAPIAAPEAAAYARAESLEGVGYVRSVREGALASPDGAAAIRVGVVSAGLFHILGVRPASGRLIDPQEALAADPENPGAAPVLVSHAFWRDRLGGGAMGAVLDVDGLPVVVVGVLPPSFRLVLPPSAALPDRAEVWIPLRLPLAGFRRADRLRDQDSDNRGIVVARLADGAGVAEATAELRSLRRRLADEWGEEPGEEERLRLTPLHAGATAAARPMLLLLLGAVLLVLLLTTANVTALLLARCSRRGSELAVRAALGATRGRLAAMIAAESAAIGAAAGLLGLLLGAWGTDLLLRFSPPSVGSVTPALDGRVLAFGLAATVATTALAATLPALRAGGTRLLPAIRAQGSMGSRETARARRALVTAEIALSLALLAGAGLLIRTVANLGRVNAGFEAGPVSTFDLALIYPDRYRGPADRGGFVRDLVGRLEALPSVAAAGVIGGLPLSGETFTQPWGRPGESPEEWSSEANMRVVSDHYFDALGTPILRGRTFGSADDRQDRRVVMVSRSLATVLDPTGQVIGRSIAFPLDGAAVEAEIVGVVEEVRFEDLRASGRPTLYVPYRHEASRRITVAVRSRDGAPVPPGPLAAAVAELDPRLPIFSYAPMRDHLRRATAETRFALAVLVGFSALAALLCVVGIYAVIAQGVTRRTAEIAVRMAMGADAAAILRMVAGEAAAFVVPGLALGLVGAVLLASTARSLLFDVTPLDPTVLTAVTALIAVAAVAAVWAPARRAARLHPADALRR
ncbi:MAG: ADOP family duplicated permease [Gemmatimonadetes bacterium]|nr:ADOP family duplicated permease [Gemmatimonadota bacterium]